MEGKPTLAWKEQEEEWRRALKAPFILSQVSSRWREIVLDTPELWSTIYVRLDRCYPPHGLRLYLERSKDVGLDIIIRESASGPWWQWEHTMTTLFSPDVMARFRRLAITHVELAPPVFGAFDNTLAFPRLESVYFLKSNLPSLYWSWLWEVVRRAPRLDNVFGIGMDESQIPFEALTESNIRSLELTSTYGGLDRGLLHVLPTLRNLESLTLRNLNSRVSRPCLPLPPVRCESLRDLKIIQSHSHTDRVILQHLDLPNLLSLDLNFREQIHSFEGLLSLLSNLASLRVLSLVFNKPPSGRIARILDKIPNLTVIAVGVHDHASSFDSLNPFPQLCAELAERPTICPKLRSLTLAMEEDCVTRSMLENIQGFIEGRGSTLSKFKLITAPPVEPRATQDEGVPTALQSIRTVCPTFEYTYLPRALFQCETPIESYRSLLD
ncbi:hypothetical protein V5O48_013427 [Marasmius crinis-equi]|uniref:F-box domain-containing protein n=1 Tax=Marasmius crinis-equi TaxID=585013 RepID=A0ABR3F043_9AGAR